MTTARKLEPQPRKHPCEIPARQNWADDNWLDEIARAHNLSQRERDLLDQPPHPDPTGEKAVREVLRRGHLRLVA